MTIPFFGQPTEENLKKHGDITEGVNPKLCNCGYYEGVRIGYKGGYVKHDPSCPCFRG